MVCLGLLPPPPLAFSPVIDGDVGDLDWFAIDKAHCDERAAALLG